MKLNRDYPEINRCEFIGNIWSTTGLDPYLTGLLEARDRLIVLRHGVPPYYVTLGVPHQAAIGAGKMCEMRRDEAGRRQPRPCDENAAGYALAAFWLLKALNEPCKLVIMAHATGHDPNKLADSPYCKELFAEDTRLLFECHGSGKSRRQDLELSAGRNQHADTPQFGLWMRNALPRDLKLAVQQTTGSPLGWLLEADGRKIDAKLELAANRTDSLLQAGQLGLPALHLEAKPAFRRAPDGKAGVSWEGWILGQAIMQAVRQYAALPNKGGERT